MSVYRTPMVFIFVAFLFLVVILCKPPHTLGMNYAETVRQRCYDADQFNDANDDILAPPRLDKCVGCLKAGMSMLSRFSRTMSSKFFTERTMSSPTCAQHLPPKARARSHPRRDDRPTEVSSPISFPHSLTSSMRTKGDGSHAISAK